MLQLPLKKNPTACNILKQGEVKRANSNLKIKTMQDVFITIAVFSGIYFILKLIADYLLRRKIIKAGHIDKAGILSPVPEGEEVNKYPSLKWGLVALMAGLGLIVIEMTCGTNEFEHSVLPFGIELVFIASGFLIYFLIMALGKKK